MKMPMYELRDPFKDFQNEEDQEWMRAVVSKKGQGLTSYDFMCIFQSHLPAGTYEECLSYLPHVFEYLTQDGAYDSDVLHNVMWFLSYYEDSLIKDGIFESILTKLKKILKRCCVFKTDRHSNLLDCVFESSHMVGSLLEYSFGLHLWKYLKAKDEQWKDEPSYNFVITSLTLDEPWVEDDEEDSMSKRWKSFYTEKRLKHITQNCVNHLYLLKNSTLPINSQLTYYKEFKALYRRQHPRI